MPTKSESLFERRKKLVPTGLGIFNPTTVANAKGAFITDVDGVERIDFAGGIGVMNAGHCPEPVVKAIQEQATKLIHSCFNVSMYEKYLELGELLVQLFPLGKETKVMLTNTGAESVENAIKFARQATNRNAVICYTNAFHGRTMMAMTLTSKTAYKVGCGPFAPEVYRIAFPDYYRFGNGKSMEDFSTQHINELKKFFSSHVAAKEVAAIILELVQGEGGFTVFPKPYIKELRKICDENGIVLIFDEVQSGFGRTGKWAAYEHYGVTPDIITLAKSMGAGMPIGAVVGKADILDKAAPSTIGGTYPGNPVCCAAAIANITYMKKININQLGEKVGDIVRERFLKMQSRFSVIGDVRGLGAMMAMELIKNNDPFQPNTELTGKLTAYCAENGLVLISSGTYGNVIRVLSPLVIDEKTLHKGLDIIEKGLEHLVK